MAQVEGGAKNLARSVLVPWGGGGGAYFPIPVVRYHRS